MPLFRLKLSVQRFIPCILQKPYKDSCRASGALKRSVPNGELDLCRAAIVIVMNRQGGAHLIKPYFLSIKGYDCSQPLIL